MIRKAMGSLPYIVAVDFDGTLVSATYPGIGKPNKELIEEIKKINLYHPDVRWVLWTCRTGESLEEAIKWCKENKLPFTSFNKNIPEVIDLFKEDTRKVYADVYVDDRNTPNLTLESYFGIFHG